MLPKSELTNRQAGLQGRHRRGKKAEKRAREARVRMCVKEGDLLPSQNFHAPLDSFLSLLRPATRAISRGEETVLSYFHVYVNMKGIAIGPP